MDNYFRNCPPMMDDGRSVGTDYRSSQIREEIFRQDNCVFSENDARTLRIENGEWIMDYEWDSLRATRSCFPAKVCFHKNPTTRVTTDYNNAEILAYNGDLPAPKCDRDCHDYRMTVSVGSKKGRRACTPSPVENAYAGYPPEKCPKICKKTNRMRPERLRRGEQ